MFYTLFQLVFDILFLEQAGNQASDPRFFTGCLNFSVISQEEIHKFFLETL